MTDTADGQSTSEFDDLALLDGLPPDKAMAVRELLRQRLNLGERCRRVIETTSDAIVITDRDRAIIFANPAAHALFGFPGSSLIGMPVADVLPPEARDHVAAYESAALDGAPQRYETDVLRADGERRIVSVSTAPLRDGAEVSGVVASLRDITGERRARDATALLEARYERLLEMAPDAIFTLDMDGRFTSVNRAFERAIGRERSELVGMSFDQVLDAPERVLADELFRTTAGGHGGKAELRYRNALGELCTGSVTATPTVEDGAVTGVLGIVRDVTGERRLADQLLQREKLAAVGQLVSGVAHELNNPLAGVMAFAQLLEAAPGTVEEQRDAVRTIHKEAKRAARIVSNLLLFARERNPERTSTDMNSVMLDALELRRYVLRTQQVEVVTDFDLSLPPVWADPFQLQQVVLNLVTNAEFALKEISGPKIMTFRTRRVGERVVASVTDNGPGIPSDVVDRIFNPFFTTKEVGEGTGLGLSISHGIIRQHGGQITVETSPGHGAAFSIELPLSPRARAEIRSGAEVEEHHAEAGYVFLIVDDEPSIRRAVVRYLEREGHAVDMAATGSEALARMALKRYDAILLDLRMPDTAGGGVYARLLESDPEHAARVVFATGDVESDESREFLRAARRPYLTKPFMLPAVAQLLCSVAAGRDMPETRASWRRTIVSDD
ncbi:MAG TPA: PAS domain S-box protein [Gemmatimonadaceae bacterium]